HRNSDGMSLFHYRARDRLSNPPRAISREFASAPPIELLDRSHQADVAFLNKVEELKTAPGVLLCDRDYEPEIRAHHFIARAGGFIVAGAHLRQSAFELGRSHVPMSFQIGEPAIRPAQL